MNSTKLHRRDLVPGAQVGSLTVVEAPKPAERRATFRCACGTVRSALVSNVLSGRTRSCGCVSGRKGENLRKHGRARTPEYVAWCNAKARCHRPSHPRFAEWGGRGIAMCDRWRGSFEAFLADMGPRPGPGYSIDRIDNDRGYEPGNCRWASAKEQSTNRPSWVHGIEFNGERLTLTDWAARIGITRKSLESRLNAGWSIEKALTTPKGAK
jgi:hypothetical protein